MSNPEMSNPEMSNTEMNNQTRERASVDAMRSKMKSQQAEDMLRMYNVVCGFDAFLKWFERGLPKHKLPTLNTWQLLKGRFLVDVGTDYFQHYKLLMLNGSRAVDRALWDYEDYCSAMAAIPSIYKQLTEYDDINTVNMLMAESLVKYAQPSV